jgi:predicted Rossmann fold flavoprotein
MSTSIVIGGGAAGFFGAIACAEGAPGRRVILIEKSSKLLAKVRISGGGRCNVTHDCFDPDQLAMHYPRGGRTLRRLFHHFQASDTVAFFEGRGVKLKAEEDGRMFPVTDDSGTVVECLTGAARRAGVVVRTATVVQGVEHDDDRGLLVRLQNGENLPCKNVLVATGGSPRTESYTWLAEMGHRIEPPVPSLFTLNVPDSPVDGLQGVAVPNARVNIEGMKLDATGPVLITHWGLSGPAVLRISAWGARLLHAADYRCTALVDWTGAGETVVRSILQEHAETHRLRKIAGDGLFDLPRRLWMRLLSNADICEDVRWLDLSRRDVNRLVEELVRCRFDVRGKTTFKEEFVTCGGVSLRDVRLPTMESKLVPGLYFAGEVLDMDGITGGFNFQAAWTTGFLAGKSMARGLAESSLPDRNRFHGPGH